MPYRRLAPWIVAGVVGLSALSAQAQVRYDFIATSSTPFNGETYTGSFSFISAGFITADTTLSVGSLLSCSVVSSGAGGVCRDEHVLFDTAPGYDIISFGVASAANIGSDIWYRFADGDLGVLGTHASQLLPNQFATVTVTQVAAVPEPSTLAAMLGGLGVLGVVGRRRRLTRPVSNAA